MHRRLIALCAALLLSCLTPPLHAGPAPALAVSVDVTHVAPDKWRVNYRFAQAVTALKFASVGNYRQQAWKLLTPRMRLTTEADTDVVAFGGKPFQALSVEISTFDGLAPKDYASFNRFSDGGTAVYLGHLQGDVQRGKRMFEMATDIQLKGLSGEHVIAPPPPPDASGGRRGYAYFGPAQSVSVGTTRFLIDPATPAWARETLLDTGAKMAGYYEKTYQRALKDELVIMVSMAGLDVSGFSIKGGAVLGQLSYRLDGKDMLADHPKKRALLARLVAHEMAHVWQMNVARGGVGGHDPWIHEGGAEAMALDALLHTAVESKEGVAAYRKAQSDTCERLGNSVASYDGIYACGLVRFDQAGMAIVPLWRAMIEASEAKGEVYSQGMIDAIVAAGKKTAAPATITGATAH